MYPEMVICPNYSDYSDYDAYENDLSKWEMSRWQQYNQPDGYADSLDGFFKDSIREFLTVGENQAYSPLNVYLAMAMLAETTDGNSRQQLLDLLGVDSIEALRTQAGHVWNAHYCVDGQTTSLLANSLWLTSNILSRMMVCRLWQTTILQVYSMEIWAVSRWTRICGLGSTPRPVDF
jgi:hypothetical protein